MIIIGVDFHPEFQQIASVDSETGEFQEKRLDHREEAETFYRALAGQKVCVGMEASGQARWLFRPVASYWADCGQRLLMGNRISFLKKGIRPHFDPTRPQENWKPRRSGDTFDQGVNRCTLVGSVQPGRAIHQIWEKIYFPSRAVLGRAARASK
jgi:hypothetical protein